jgi:hypothetical protein
MLGLLPVMELAYAGADRYAVVEYERSSAGVVGRHHPFQSDNGFQDSDLEGGKGDGFENEDTETQDAEDEDAETNGAESQDAESQDAEIQDAEIQDDQNRDDENQYDGSEHYGSEHDGSEHDGSEHDASSADARESAGADHRAAVSAPAPASNPAAAAAAGNATATAAAGSAGAGGGAGVGAGAAGVGVGAAGGAGAAGGVSAPDLASSGRAFGPDEALPADLSDVALVDSIVAGARTVSREHARQCLRVSELAHRRAGTAIGQLTGRPAKGDAAISIGAQAVADELAHALTLTQWHAEKLVFTAVGLHLQTPDVLDALLTGDIDLPRAEVIQDYAHTLIAASLNDDPDHPDPDQLARDLTGNLLNAAKDQTTSQLKRTAEDALIRVNPAAAERRHATKRTRRHIRLIPDSDGMCFLSMYLPADQGVRILAALKALVEASWADDDSRTLDQAGVDALYDLVMTALATFGGTDAQHHCTHPEHHHSHPTTSTSDPTGESAPANRSDRMSGPDSADGPDTTSVADEMSGSDATTGHGGTSGSDANDESGEVTEPDLSNGPDLANGSDPVNRTGAFNALDVTGGASGTNGSGAKNEPDANCESGETSLAATEPEAEPVAQPENESSPQPPGQNRTARKVLQKCSEETFSDGPGSCLPPDQPEDSERAGRSSKAARRRRRRADTQVLLTISAETLTGICDAPGYLGGYGPIIASMARTVAATGTWRCAITDTTHGTLDGLGVSTYTPEYEPTAQLRRHLIARDTHCRWPGCTRPARRCDIDHVVPYSRGGATCECNTENLCAHHHRVKHETGFTVAFSTNPEHPPGTLIFTSPTGRQRITYPDPLQQPATSGAAATSGTAASDAGTVTSGSPGTGIGTVTSGSPGTGIGTVTSGSPGPGTGTATSGGPDGESNGEAVARRPRPDSGPPPF